ncbi:hypothetical protein [Kineosporia sp. R_H_3]|uniref:hypothetical protein n=1 Tax=Kineosporia sp. R_H_3 TaxID=1961848 RepID=UPI000B4A5D24|nr:hypothetical protein [Kineosporia sp. R_H_3]MBI4941260.1 hypothetical protein [Actinomycetota bacterium]
MTIIKAACPTCGDVELTKDQVRLVVHAVRSRSFYSFDCTSCVSQVKKPAGDEVVRLLTLGGVVAERIEVPAEALEVHEGKALTSDDLLDFAAWIEDAENVVQAAAAGLHARLLTRDQQKQAPGRS